MSATNFTPIQLYRTTTASATPSAGNLADGELAINLTDEALYFKNAAGVVKLLADSSGALGSVTSVDVSGGTTGLTTSGGPITSSGTITLGGTLGVANGGTGTSTAFTAGSVVFAGASGVYSQDNANLFWDDTNNQLGIGTASPSSFGVLAVVKNQTADTAITVSNGGTGSATTTMGFNLAETGAAQGWFRRYRDGSANTEVGFSDALLFTGNVSSTKAERMRITSAGNLGIGTASPSQRLDVTVSSGTEGDGLAVTNTFITAAGGYGSGINFFSVRSDGTTKLGSGAIRMFGESGWTDAASTSSNMRFYTVNANTLAERMRITSAGNVGIGTSSPGAKLHTVSTAGFTAPNLLCTDTVGTFRVVFQSSTYAGVPANKPWLHSYDDIYIGSDAATSFNVMSGGTNTFKVDSSGNVGIGTSSPGSLLTVNGNILAPWANSGTYEIGVEQRSTNAFSTNTNVFVVRGADAIAGGNAMGGGSVLIRGGKGFGTAGGSAGNVTIQGGADVGGATTTPGVIIFNTGAPTTEVMRINAAGLVGIGTSAPGYRLDVSSGDTANTLNISSNSLATYSPSGYNGASARVFMRGGNSVGTFTGTQFTHGGNFEAFFGAVQNAANTADFVFQGYSGSAYEERMRINAAGNVGIGTSSVAGGRVQINGATSDTDGLGLDQGQLLITDSDAAAANGMMLGYRFQSGITEYGRIQCRNAIGATNLILQAGGGNVGIGTSSPTTISGYTSLKINNATNGAILDLAQGDTFRGRLVATSGSFAVETNTGIPISFAPAGTERARIDSSGNLLVGATAIPSSSVAGIALKADLANNASTWSCGTKTAASTMIEFVNGNGQVGTIITSGTATAYNTSSDYRLKEINGPIANSGAYIDALKPVQGSWKADGSRFIGLLAHEVQEVSETTIATGEKDGEKMQAMDYSAPELIANLIAEIQSLRARVAQLEGN